MSINNSADWPPIKETIPRRREAAK